MRRRHLLRVAAPGAALALAAGAAACASSGSTSAGGPVIRDPMANMPVTTQVDGLNATYTVRQINGTDDGTAFPVPADPARTFAAMPGAYQSLALEVNTMRSDILTAGVREVAAPRRINRQPLSHFLDCGVSATGTPNADSYAVTITAMSRVMPGADSSSSVTTQVVAVATSRGVSSTAVRCGSNGRLEAAINAAIALAAAAAR